MTTPTEARKMLLTRCRELAHGMAMAYGADEDAALRDDIDCELASPDTGEGLGLRPAFVVKDAIRVGPFRVGEIESRSDGYQWRMYGGATGGVFADRAVCESCAIDHVRALLGTATTVPPTDAAEIVNRRLRPILTVPVDANAAAFQAMVLELQVRTPVPVKGGEPIVHLADVSDNEWPCGRHSQDTDLGDADFAKVTCLECLRARAANRCNRNPMCSTATEAKERDPCKPDIFAATYEAVSDAPDAPQKAAPQTFKTDADLPSYVDDTPCGCGSDVAPTDRCSDCPKKAESAPVVGDCENCAGGGWVGILHSACDVCGGTGKQPSPVPLPEFSLADIAAGISRAGMDPQPSPLPPVSEGPAPECSHRRCTSPARPHGTLCEECSKWLFTPGPHGVCPCDAKAALPPEGSAAQPDTREGREGLTEAERHFDAMFAEFIAQRRAQGRITYGRGLTHIDSYDWNRMALEEVVDGMAYMAAENRKLRDAVDVFRQDVAAVVREEMRRVADRMMFAHTTTSPACREMLNAMDAIERDERATLQARAVERTGDGR